jgi:hypothetical protein
MSLFRKQLRDRTHAGEFDIHVEFNAEGGYWYAWTKHIDAVKGEDITSVLIQLGHLIEEST